MTIKRVDQKRFLIPDGRGFGSLMITDYFDEADIYESDLDVSCNPIIIKSYES
jgi:hypothetical protein